MPALIQTKKSLVSLIIFLAFVIVAILLFSSPSQPDNYYSVHLDDGDVWYGQVVNDDPSTIVLDQIYRFNEKNSHQLVRYDPDIREPKEFNRDHVLSAEALSADSAVLKAILKYEGGK